MDLSYREATLALLDYTPLFLYSDDTLLAIGNNNNIIAIDSDDKVVDIGEDAVAIGDYYLACTYIYTKFSAPTITIKLISKNNTNRAFFKKVYHSNLDRLFLKGINIKHEANVVKDSRYRLYKDNSADMLLKMIEADIEAEKYKRKMHIDMMGGLNYGTE